MTEKKTSRARATRLNGKATAGEATLEEEAVVKPKRRARKTDSPTPKPRRTKAKAAQPEAPPAEEVIDPSLRQQLQKEIEDLIGRLRSLNPGYAPPPFSPQNLIDLLQENKDRIPPGLQFGILEKLKGTLGEDVFDVDTWKGMWFVLNSSLQYQADVVKRRMTGEYETDEWGMDREVIDAVLPFAQFLYKTYWRVEMRGLENIPDTGRALLVANHSGQLPFDGMMLATGVLLDHPVQRITRTLYATWFPTLPLISDLFVKCGQVLANEDNGIRLLEQEELVAVFPEGYKGVGKLFKDRYQLARFGRGGFVRMALKAKAPIIPVSIVGAEETYISIHKSNFMAKLTGFPYFPISPTFPLMGLLGLIPLPTKWYIDIGTPIPMDTHKANAANNMMLVSQLTDQVRNVVQEMVLERLSNRRSVFWG